MLVVVIRGAVSSMDAATALKELGALKKKIRHMDNLGILLGGYHLPASKRQAGRQALHDHRPTDWWPRVCMWWSDRPDGV